MPWKDRIVPLGDAAAMIRLGDTIDEGVHRRVLDLARRLEAHPFPGYIEASAAFTTVTAFYDPHRTSYAAVRSWLTQLLADETPTTPSMPRRFSIPVVYGGMRGPDMERVASYCGLSVQEVIDLHAGAVYRVYMIGFAPGFPYLGGLPERLAVPRRDSPRLAVPAGSVAIAGLQAGIYPIETPGGWQIIGWTPLALFRPSEDPPSLLQAGDEVRFTVASPDDAG